MATLGRLCTELALLPGPSTQREALPIANRSACVCRGQGDGRKSHPFAFKTATYLGKISCLPRSLAWHSSQMVGRQGRCWLVQLFHSPGERGLEKDFHGPLFSMQSVYPEGGRMHRVKLRTPDVLAGPPIS